MKPDRPSLDFCCSKQAHVFVEKHILRRDWGHLSACQRNDNYYIYVISLLFLLYIISTGETRLVIAKMDATANEVPSQFNVQGFPAIYMVPGNVKSPVEYTGNREVCIH